ncbi:YtpI family protein [Salibacterium aidingense]|uniref:YtpI family protein n=1 Tax=Salibacterium aidingense TaxID=384933 RepID=UPI001E3EF1D2|nr:YtpI family protein [Salibacterium aidingense]
MTPFFIIILVVALAMYIFYKVKAVRAGAPAFRKWVQAKANISLGLFMAAFGGNLLVSVRDTIDIIVGAVFLAVGAVNVIFGYRAYRMYTPYAAEEAEKERLDT